MNPFRKRLGARSDPPAPRRLRIAINRRHIRSPYGGGNQALALLGEFLRERGHTVTHDLDEATDAILLFDPRPGPEVTFSTEDIQAFKRRHPAVGVVHRVNECDKRKGTTNVDALLGHANRVADHTVFVSQWLREYFVREWKRRLDRSTVILNGADPRIFKPPLTPPPPSMRPCRVVTHHWSDNWAKGFHVYQEVDRAIAEGRLPGFQLHVIGRWPKEIRWKTAQTHAPARGKSLARLLGANHLYLTASTWDPGPMHTAEGAQCGLPIVFHQDGGGIVEFAQNVGVPFRGDVVGALTAARDQIGELRSRVASLHWSGATMCRAYEELLLQVARPSAQARGMTVRSAG